MHNTHALYIQTIEKIGLYNDIHRATAVISSCDAVVTIAVLTGYLAGALKKETHILVPRNPSFY